MKSPTTAAKSKRPTIYDLAKMAGVSPGTVSRVLNNKDKVKADTRARVLQAAQHLGLKPQASVRSKQIVLVTEPSYENRLRGYTAILMAHISFALTSRNIGIFIPIDPVHELKNYFIDGIIAISFEDEVLETLTELETRVPVVYLDNFKQKKGQYTVRSDHYQSGKIAAEHLISKGKTKLGYISSRTAPNERRVQGFKDAIEAAGLEIEPRRISIMEKDSHSPTVVSRIVRAGADCIFVPGSSHEVIQCVHAIEFVMNMKVPQDISIVGGENLGITEFLNPPITTVSEPLKEMAEKAVDMIIQLTEGEKPSPRVVDLDVELIERDSVE